MQNCISHLIQTDHSRIQNTHLWELSTKQCCPQEKPPEEKVFFPYSEASSFELKGRQRQSSFCTRQKTSSLTSLIWYSGL